MNLFRDVEWRVFIGVLVVAIAAVTINLLTQAGSRYSTLGRALRSSSFQVTSIFTTTGFGTDNTNAWPAFSKLLLVLLMITGGCGGSTAGGIKVARLVILVRLGLLRIEKVFRPQTVRALRIGGTVLGEDVIRAVTGFVILYMAVVITAALVVAATGPDIVTSFTAVTATINTTGPGLEKVGSIENYAHLAPVAKVVLSLCMVLGRLELFAILVLFVPAFWKTG